jgi:hypothetical protein
MAFSTFNSFHNSRVKSLVKSVLQGFTFRITGTGSTVPSTDVNGLALTNVSGVTMINDATRGYVFNFNGTNSLTINPGGFTFVGTKTFWLKIPTGTAAALAGHLFSTALNQTYIDSPASNPSNNFYVTENLQSSGESLIVNTSSNSQGKGVWIFYAITYSTTSITTYTNGVQTNSLVFTKNPTTETAVINIGSYPNNTYQFTGLLDDVRLYPSALTASQVLSIYNGA